jgi:hypothetical protein
MQEAVPGVIGNQQKCRLEGPEIINNGALERQGSLQIDLWKLICKSASGEVSFMLIYVENVRFWAPLWIPLDFEGVPKSCF